MSTLIQDLRFGLRMLAKNPGFTAVAVLMLALGIGAGTAIFSILYAVAIQPLPYQDSDQLVELWPKKPQTFGNLASGPDFLDWANQSNVFSGLAASGPYQAKLTDDGQTEDLDGFQVTPDFFKVLGGRPAEGRFFVTEDEKPGRDHVAILGPGFRTRKLGKDLSAIGTRIKLDGEEFEVIGAVPDSFRFPGLLPGVNPEPDVFVPIPLEHLNKNRGQGRLFVIGRLKPGITMRQAQTQMTTIATRLAQQYPESNKDIGIEVERLGGLVRGATRTVLGSVLFFGVGFLLLLSCSNVAILTLTRGARRRHEIAIRQAVGGSRARVAVQFLTESMIVALAGGVVGVLLAYWFKDGLLALDPAHFIPVTNPISINYHVLIFALGIAFVTGLLFGLNPALRLSRVNLQEILKEGACAARSGVGPIGDRDVYVVLEVMLALLLLIVCGLMIRPLARLMAGRPGFNPRNIVTASLALTDSKYPTLEARNAFARELISRLNALPTVQAAAFEGPSLGHASTSESALTVSGFEAGPLTRISSVSPDYFHTMQLPLLRGRHFTWADYREKPTVAIINSAMARNLWPSQDALGKHLTVSYPPEWYIVVGIVTDDARPGAPTLPGAYLPISPARVNLLVRTTDDSEAARNALFELIKNVDKNGEVGSIHTMEEDMARRANPIRNVTILLGCMTIVLALLATVGVYAVVAYSVARRTHEIGVRVALGAQRKEVLLLVMRDGIRLSLIGVVLGLGLALAVGRILAAFVYGVKFGETSTYLGVSLLLFAVTLLACYIPARRATKVDPMVALRYE